MPPQAIAILAGLVAAGSALPAHAVEETAPEPTQRYRIVDVAPDDVLNIRSHAGPANAIVGTLPPDATDIVVSGARLRIDGSTWWQVVAPETEGWVNARHLAPRDETLPDREAFPLQCVGTEPFWSLRVAEDEAVFDTPEEEQQWQAAPMSHAIGLVGRFAVPLESEEGTGHLAAWRNPGFCSDGMSDIGFPFEALVIAPDGRVFGGCCRRAGE